MAFKLISETESTLVEHADRMKDSVIAKLANQAADYYGEAFKQCHCKDSVPKVRARTHTHTQVQVCAYFVQ